VAIVSDRIRHAARPGVRNLILHARAETLVQRSLQSVVALIGAGLSAGNLIWLTRVGLAARYGLGSTVPFTSCFWKNGIAAIRCVPCWPTYPTLSTLLSGS